jgi:hypothetical protein
LLGFAHVRGEGEYSASRLGAEDDGGESDEELENSVLMVSNKIASVPVALLVTVTWGGNEHLPESESNTKKHH